MPSACGALTSARRCKRARTAARSIFSIASASGALAAAAETLTAARRNAEPNRTNDMKRIVLPARLQPRATCTAFARRAERLRARAPGKLQHQQLVDLALAVGERVETDANLVEQRQVQVGQRRRLGVLDVPSALLP